MDLGDRYELGDGIGRGGMGEVRIALVSQLLHLTGVTLIGKRTAEAARNHQHAVAWHLRQAETSGRVRKVEP